jgi:U3 small nucleolar RNA-associated protein 14
LPNDKSYVARDNIHLNNVRDSVSSNNNNMRKLLHPTKNDLISTLSVENVKKQMHSGNYTCAPSNAKKTSIMVHVVDGKNVCFLI